MKVLACLVAFCAVLQAARAAYVGCYIMGARADIPNTCTHINYAFASVGADGSLKGDAGSIKTLVGIKSKNPGVKILVSVGGAGASAATFSAIVADPAKRATFIKTSRAFLEANKADGIDLDWEVPGAKDKANLVSLFQEMKADFSKNNWLITAAVPADGGAGYDIPNLSKYLDLFNVMTYDMYGPWSQYTGQNSALYPSPVESSFEKDNLNMQAAMNHWTSGGAPASKLMAGVAFYGHSFTLANPANHGLHAAIKGAGKGGGDVTYAQFCKDKTWQCTWDDTQKMPICVSGDQWLGIDNERSIQAKVDFIKSKGFGGAMIWALNQDDISGSCGKAWPLLTAVGGVK